ncbi:MAG: gamma-glutamyltransferase [Planctomycetes bacterium]|nr:gamma-glutamyltransferase [Planctomycetota bacterium]
MLNSRPGLLAASLMTCLHLTAVPGPAQVPAHGNRGMVSSAHPIATEAGLEILKAGGNAFDASIAIATTLNVVQPMMSGIGGYGTIITYHAATKSAQFLNCSAHIPFGVDSDAYRAPTPNYLENQRGAKAVSTPGNVPAWEEMSRRYGSLDWADLFAPAITVADDGFVIGERTSMLISIGWENFPEHAKVFYGHDDAPLNPGERLVQTDLANSLRMIAKGGGRAMRDGSLAMAIDQAMRNADGFLRLDDLKRAKGEWWDPISIDYRGFEVITASPPATAFPSLIRLGMMSQFDSRKLGHNSAAYLHRFAEVTKHAFWCRLRYAGDPDFTPPPLEKLLSKDYWAKQVAKIDLDRATTFVPPGENVSRGDMHTTHFVVADEMGNVVSATQTLGNLFGSRIMPEGTGIWLNNSLRYCTFEPAGNPMDAHAGHHKLSGDCPTLIMKDGRPWVAIGTPGGHTIGQTVPQMVMNIIDFGMNVQEAISAPRVSFFEPNGLAVEEGVDESVRSALAAMGHQLEIVRGLGNAHGLAIEYDDKGNPVRFTGAADPRGKGVAKGFD